MLLYKLKDLEVNLDRQEMDDTARLEAIRSLIELLLQIDHKSETMMDDSLEKVLSILSFIKNAPLTDLQREEIVRLML